MNNFIKIVFCASGLLLAAVAFGQINPFDMQFPIPELGNCASMGECKIYCDDPLNQDACFDWAKGKGFVKEEQGAVQKEREEKVGPGGCKNREECDIFCSKPENTEICLQFAVQSGSLTQEDADFLAKQAKMRREHKEGKPGGVPVKSEINEDKIKEMMAASDFSGPAGCKNMDECEAICEKPENQEVCLEFAAKNNLMPQEEIEKAKKMMSLGKMSGPGGCMGREECDKYCMQPDHGDECFAFAKANGLMSEEEIQMMEKEREIVGKLDRKEMSGPGGCMGQEECDKYCSNPDNFEICANFAGKQGMRRMEDVERTIQEFKGMEQNVRQVNVVNSFRDMAQSGAGVLFRKKSAGMIEFIITDSNGIKEFAFVAQDGSAYSGGVAGCPREFKSDSSFFAAAQYPMTAKITNCNSEIKEINIASPEGAVGVQQVDGGKMIEQQMAPTGEMMEMRIRMPQEGTMYQERQMYQEGTPPMNQQEGIRCDFNNDGAVDEFEGQKCAEGQMMAPQGPGETFLRPEYAPPTEQQRIEPMPQEYIPVMEPRILEEQQTLEQRVESAPTLQPTPTNEPIPVPVPSTESQPTSNAIGNVVGFVLEPFLQLFR